MYYLPVQSREDINNYTVANYSGVPIYEDYFCQSPRHTLMNCLHSASSFWLYIGIKRIKLGFGVSFRFCFCML